MTLFTILPRGPASGGGAPRAFGFEGQRGLTAGAPQDWGKQRLHSWKAHTRSHAHWDPGLKQLLHRNLGQTYMRVSEGLLGRRGAAVAQPGGIKIGGRYIREYSSSWTLVGG